ncbi:RHS repeat-associated core domain-containing protein [Pseudoalteromonas sp. CO302Y]|uniref:RHS repeat domain-containing protein n=1 Tax=unclassified Pseudoalteromonas TaxID=194690 RepID=UPI003208D5B3
MITDYNSYATTQGNYDPFGKPRLASGGLMPVGNAKLNDLTDAKTRRGFTDHEHLDDIELIHMNGRVYDYNLGRFMSVDPIIQSPTNSQSINPYSYIMNNPLSGTDPTGYCAAETGTNIKSCVDVEVKDADTGEVLGTKSMNSRHSNFAGNVADFAASKLGNGAQVTGMLAHTKGGDTLDLMNQQTLAKGNIENANLNRYITDERDITGEGNSLNQQLSESSDEREFFKKNVQYEFIKHNPDGTPVIMYESFGQWKDTLVDDIFSASLSFAGKIPKTPDLTSGVSMPTGVQYRAFHYFRVPYYERYEKTHLFSINKSNLKDIELLGIYSDKLNYEVFPNYEKAKLIRTDYQLRHCSNGNCSAPSTFLWNNY